MQKTYFNKVNIEIDEVIVASYKIIKFKKGQIIAE